jgi:hypothetical protein
MLGRTHLASWSTGSDPAPRGCRHPAAASRRIAWLTRRGGLTAIVALNEVQGPTRADGPHPICATSSALAQSALEFPPPCAPVDGDDVEVETLSGIISRQKSDLAQKLITDRFAQLASITFRPRSRGLLPLDAPDSWIHGLIG